MSFSSITLRFVLFCPRNVRQEWENDKRLFYESSFTFIVCTNKCIPGQQTDYITVLLTQSARRATQIPTMTDIMRLILWKVKKKISIHSSANIYPQDSIRSRACFSSFHHKPLPFNFHKRYDLYGNCFKTELHMKNIHINNNLKVKIIFQRKACTEAKPKLSGRSCLMGIWCFGECKSKVRHNIVFYFKFKYLNPRLPGLHFLAFALRTTCGMSKLTGPTSACFNEAR